MKIKICSRCEQEKPATTEFFYGCQSRKGGLQYWCKTCNAEYYQFHRTRVLECKKMYDQTFIGKEVLRRSSKKNREDHPERIKARNAVNNAITAGKMQRSVFCEMCGLPVET